MPVSESWPIKRVATFFYYEDLPRAVDFYVNTLGFPKVVDLGWCAIVQLMPEAQLGLVNATGGLQRPVPGQNKGAILTLETDDLPACLARMRELGVAHTDTRIEHQVMSHIHAFKVLDPEGYTLEFFTWARAAQ